jgi:CRISPR-associated protein Csm2
MSQNRSYNQNQGQRDFSSGGGSRSSREFSQGSRQQETSLIALLAKIDFNSLTPDIFSDIAEKTAGLVKDSGQNKKNNRTQLRRFYDELDMWNERVQQEQGKEGRCAKYTELEPFIKMLKAKVIYAKGRDHVDETFAALFSHCIGKVNSPKSLKHCQLFMEAFMGYYRALDKNAG